MIIRAENINPWKNKARTGDFYSSLRIYYRRYFVRMGIRRSNINQWIPIKDASHNTERAIRLGLFKFHVTVGSFKDGDKKRGSLYDYSEDYKN